MELKGGKGARQRMQRRRRKTGIRRRGTAEKGEKIRREGRAGETRRGQETK